MFPSEYEVQKACVFTRLVDNQLIPNDYFAYITELQKPWAFFTPCTKTIASMSFGKAFEVLSNISIEDPGYAYKLIINNHPEKYKNAS